MVLVSVLWGSGLGSGIETLLWTVNFVVGVGGLFVSLNVWISHDDMRSRVIEPVELADCLKVYLPVEYALSAVYFGVCLLTGPLYSVALTLPLLAFNLARFRRKDHKIYFITKREYKHNYKRMETQFMCKCAFYVLLFGLALV